MKLLLLALALTPASTCIEDHGGAQAAASPFFDCVTREARKMERSKEPSREVAVAAVTSCQPALVQFRDLLRTCGRTVESVSALTDKMNEIARDRAITTVVGIRASRP